MNARTFFLYISPLICAAAVWVLISSRLPAEGELMYWDHEVVEEVQRRVDARFVDAVDDRRQEELFDAAMQGYVNALDPFSHYFTADETGGLEEDTEGRFTGVGVRVRATSDGLLVSAVFRGGPAETAGVEPGDMITAVDEEPTAGRTTDELIPLVKGEEGTKVTLHVDRGGEQLAIAVTRRVVPHDTVPGVRLIPGELPVAYVRVSQFADSTPGEVRERLVQMVEQGGARAVVLDLRQNLGGVVSAAVEIAGLFLPAETLVCITHTRDGSHEYVTEEATPALRDLPVALLVDSGSASASEILAGALQDHGRAVLVGERTYGKFLMQTLMELDAADALLRVTTARYETPSGRSGQRNEVAGVRGGIMPDIRVPLLTESAYFGMLQAFNDQMGPSWRALPGELPDAQEDKDPQLKAALTFLRGDMPVAEPVPTRGSEEG